MHNRTLPLPAKETAADSSPAVEVVTKPVWSRSDLGPTAAQIHLWRYRERLAYKVFGGAVAADLSAGVRRWHFDAGRTYAARRLSTLALRTADEGADPALVRTSCSTSSRKWAKRSPPKPSAWSTQSCPTAECARWNERTCTPDSLATSRKPARRNKRCATFAKPKHSLSRRQQS
ncbi:hypothetical protein Aglo03_14270 [Actinokineospora globicatena]|uniref:Uncharacterized protein n=1 Tax=Actinokineospora globicatena TaxID=103729 RepID=A0A9W6QID3_9PSEU|nr:hypothetical protein Aglo03_14270 [Actinokineospora globicatena]